MPETSRERSSSQNAVAPKVLENFHLRFILVLLHLATPYYSSYSKHLCLSRDPSGERFWGRLHLLNGGNSHCPRIGSIFQAGTFDTGLPMTL